MNAEKELERIAKACADNGVSDTDDVPLADVIRGAFSQLRGEIQSLETAREFAYAEIKQLKLDTALRACAEAPETTESEAAYQKPVDDRAGTSRGGDQLRLTVFNEREGCESKYGLCE